jgi:hypothetical protein
MFGGKKDVMMTSMRTWTNEMRHVFGMVAMVSILCADACLPSYSYKVTYTIRPGMGGIADSIRAGTERMGYVLFDEPFLSETDKRLARGANITVQVDPVFGHFALITKVSP